MRDEEKTAVRRRHGKQAPVWMQREAMRLIRTLGLKPAARESGLGDDALMRIATGADVTTTTLALAEINLRQKGAVP